MQRVSLLSTLLLGLAALIACAEESVDRGASSPDMGSPSAPDADESATADGGADAATNGGDAMAMDAQTPATEVPTCAEILAALGAQGIEGAAPSVVAGHQRTFGRLDANGDAVVTIEEYIAAGHFGENQARLIYAATDRDGDGEVTEQEYVDNRIITDEAKLIFEDLDTDSDGALREGEFVENAPFEAGVSAMIYGYFDTDGDGEVRVPEYLRVWGAWARDERCP